MTGNPYKTVSTGDPVKMGRDWFNAATQPAQGFKRGRVNAGQAARALSSPEGLVRVGNHSGADVDRFQVLGIDDVFWGPSDNLGEFQNNPALLGVTPTKADHTGRFVITAQPIAHNGTGLAWAFGVAVCRQPRPTPESSTPARVTQQNDKCPTVLPQSVGQNRTK